MRLMIYYPLFQNHAAVLTHPAVKTPQETSITCRMKTAAHLERSKQRWEKVAVLTRRQDPDTDGYGI
jgi:hypothetical protein